MAVTIGRFALERRLREHAQSNDWLRPRRLIVRVTAGRPPQDGAGLVRQRPRERSVDAYESAGDELFDLCRRQAACQWCGLAHANPHRTIVSRRDDTSRTVGRSVRSAARRADRHTIRDYTLRLAEPDDLATSPPPDSLRSRARQLPGGTGFRSASIGPGYARPPVSCQLENRHDSGPPGPWHTTCPLRRCRSGDAVAVSPTAKGAPCAPTRRRPYRRRK